MGLVAVLNVVDAMMGWYCGVFGRERLGMEGDGHGFVLRFRRGGSCEGTTSLSVGD